MGYTASAFVKIAEAEVGYTEKASNSQLDNKTANAGNKNFTKYGRDLFKAGFFNGNKNGFDWCAQFVTWCAWKLTGEDRKKAESILCVAGTLSAGCGFAMNYYKKAGRFDKNPKVGDQIFFKYSNDDSTADHTGIVVKVTSSQIETIEGNSGNKVSRCTYSRNYNSILGYGHPRFDPEPKTTTTSTTKTSTSTSATAKNCTVSLPVLSRGSTGATVKTVQRILRELDYVGSDGKLLVVDGSFGPGTEAAVKRYQKKRGSTTCDGIVGAWTWAKLLKG